MEIQPNNDACTLNDIKDKLDVIYERPVGDLVTEWKRRVVDRNQKAHKPFSMLWIAGPEEKTTKVIDYVRKELGIPENSVIQFTIDENTPAMHNELVVLADQVKTMNANCILIIAEGFEKLCINNTHDRIGHDWEQGVLENPNGSEWGKLYNNMNKHMVIITTIGLSSGNENYTKAVRNALFSQFRRGIIELH